MWQWSEHLKLGKSAAFVKRDLRRLPLTGAEFEADFFLDPEFSTKRRERWMGKRHAPVPSYAPMTTVSIHLATEELRAIITETDIARTKKLRPRLEAVVAGERVDLSLDEWGAVCFALCGARTKDVRVGKTSLRIAVKIANRLAEALDIDGPASWLEKKCR